ncbi:MAG: segregation/condensation protein A, partial [Bacillota bacterium]
MDAILARLHHRGKLSFRELFSGPASRPEVIAVFLALLELIRLARVVVRQDSRFGEILIHAAPGGSAGGV